MARFETVSLLTDLGTDDEFVGVMKAIIRDIAPHASTIDLTHGIRPFDVRSGALALARSISYVPSGVIIASVDPGVGGSRRPVAISVADGEGVLVGPDNGLLAPAVSMAGGAELAVELNNADYHLTAPGVTAAARDIFAPVAAHICNGVDLKELGEPVDPTGLLPGTVPLPRHEGDELVCEVLWVDRFGNAELNIGPDDLPAAWGNHIQVKVAGLSDTAVGEVRRTRRVASFSELDGSNAGLIVDGAGMLAVALNQRSAADELGLAPGAQVTLVELDAPVSSPTRVEAPSVRRPDPMNDR